jgi:hypothetical protein
VAAMSSFNPRDFLPKVHNHNASSNQSMRSQSSRLSLRTSRLGLSKRPSTVLNQTQTGTQAPIKNVPTQTPLSAASEFVAPQAPFRAVSVAAGI